VQQKDRMMINKLLSIQILFMTCLLFGQETNIRQLTDGEFSSRSPVWSPDGSYIVFESDRAGNWDLYILEVATCKDSALTTSTASDRFPNWSPDGNQIIFVSDREGEKDLYTLNVSSGAIECLVNLPGDEMFPAWSPDGSEIGFSRKTDTSFELVQFSLKDLITTNFLQQTGRDLWPRWSSDKTRLVFFSRRDTEGKDDDIYVLELTSGNINRLTNKAGHDFCPSWHPNGELIVFVSVLEDGSRSLCIVDLDGKVKSRLGKGFYRVTEPSWSPDGKYIVYTGAKNQDDNYSLFIETVQ
jgi:TolB protein